jgi:hypothetical protein
LEVRKSILWRAKQEIKSIFDQKMKLFCHFSGDQKLKLRFDLLITAVFKRSEVENNAF